MADQPDEVLDVETPHGPARVHVRRPATDSRGALALGHGAGGSVSAADLTAVAGAATGRGLTVVLVEQPYRVAGRRSPAPAHQLDAAWTAVIGDLRERGVLAGGPLVAGGRSSGARVACRTAAATAAAGVVCLAFPLHPPRRGGAGAGPTRLPELEAVTVPVLVVQGASDPFGMPPAGPRRTVVEVPGTHSLRSGLSAIGTTVADWIDALLAQR